MPIVPKNFSSPRRCTPTREAARMLVMFKSVICELDGRCSRLPVTKRITFAHEQTNEM